MLGIIVSTGVGGGIVADGRLMHGATGQAGHIGHVIVMPEGARCPCGALGRVTAYASGTGLAARAVEELDGGAGSGLSSLPRHAVTAAAIAEAAADADDLPAGFSMGPAAPWGEGSPAPRRSWISTWS